MGTPGVDGTTSGLDAAQNIARDDRTGASPSTRTRQSSAPSSPADTIDLTARAQVEAARARPDREDGPAGRRARGADAIDNADAATGAAEDLRAQILAQPVQAARAQANSSGATVLAMLA